MSCPQCSSSLEARVPFCRDCGASLLGNREGRALRSDVEPIASVRPVFSAGRHLSSHAGGYLFLASWSTFFFGGLGHVVLSRSAEPHPTWLPFVLVAMVAVVLLPTIGMRIAHAAHKRTELVLYPHRLTCSVGFGMRRQRTIAYREIQEIQVELPSGSNDGVGSLLIATLGSQTGREMPLRLTHVPAAEAVAARLRALIADVNDQVDTQREAA